MQRSMESSKRQREMVFDIAERIAGLGYALWDERTRSYVFVSKQFAKPYGLTPSEYVAQFGSYESEIVWIHPDDRERYEAHYRSYLEDPRECSIEARFGAPGTDYRHIREFYAPVFDAAGRLSHTVVVELHIGELKRAEEALRQAQKMEAVGQLTGGIAHDFNNLLAVIIGNLELVSERRCDARATAEFIAMAMGAAQRGADLTRRLLTLSRSQPTSAETVDLRELADEMLELLRRTLGSRIAIDVKGPTDLWRCRVDRGQFENSLLNLALNARDAMSEGGTLSIEFANIEIDPDYDVYEMAIDPGRYVRVQVTDTGIGMAPETAERALEPFFTTKTEGAGSGLGLSMVYGFVKQSSGYIRIDSRYRHGTTVQLLIPRDSSLEPTAVSDLCHDSLPRAHGECLLLVDDDDSVLRMTGRMLESIGYSVRSARSVREALEALHGSARVDLLITDIMLGGGDSGPELAREVEHERPDLPVLFMSGYPQHRLEESGFVSSEVAFLAKPFRKSDVALAVRAALERKRI